MHTNPNGLNGPNRRNEATGHQGGKGSQKPSKVSAVLPSMIWERVTLTNAECRGQSAEGLKEKGSGLSRADGVTLGVAANKSTERIDAFIRSRFLLREVTGGEPE